MEDELEPKNHIAEMIQHEQSKTRRLIASGRPIAVTTLLITAIVVVLTAISLYWTESPRKIPQEQTQQSNVIESLILELDSLRNRVQSLEQNEQAIDTISE